MYKTFDKVDVSRKKGFGEKVLYNGEYKSLPEWAEAYNIKYKLLHERLFRRNMPMEDALKTPVNDYFKVIEYNGEKMNLSQWAKKLGIKQVTLHRRINVLNMSVEKALTMPIQVNKRAKKYLK